MMESLNCIEVAEDDDIKSGFSIIFKFDKNDYFTNTTVAKKYFIDPAGVVTNTTTKIDWKPKKNPCEKEETESEFTEWLQENSDDTSDDVADLIKDDLWVNPFQYYLGIDEDEEGDDDDDE